MTLLEEAKAHMEKMREHTDCCGMPIFRRMVAEVERLPTRPDIDVRYVDYLPHMVNSNDPRRLCLRCGLAGDELQLSCKP